MTLARRFPFDFDEIRVFDDNLDDFEIMRRIIDLEDLEDPFHLLNVGDVIRKHRLWIEHMPRVVPHYAVKCNPNHTVIKVLASMGANFDCASKDEIVSVMQYGVPSHRIIFANPIKTTTQIMYARKVGVNKLTADSMWELRKIKEFYPEAKVIIRFRCDSSCSDALLGLKYGCDPNNEAVRLIRLCRELNLDLHGFSFHVGSPCGEVMAMSRGIGICKYLIDVARTYGYDNLQLIDIGGGIPGERDFSLDEFSEVINEALEDVDSSIKVISEPGRYYVTSAFTSAALCHGKKSMEDGNFKKYMYYVNDGVYGSFIEELLNLKARIPKALNKPENPNEPKYLSTLWGPTCDSFDCILKDVYLPEYEIGDWLYWRDMGAYTTCLASNFNGFPPPKIFPVIRRTEWENFCKELGRERNDEVELSKIEDDDRESF